MSEAVYRDMRHLCHPSLTASWFKCCVANRQLFISNISTSLSIYDLPNRGNSNTHHRLARWVAVEIGRLLSALISIQKQDVWAPRALFGHPVIWASAVWAPSFGPAETLRRTVINATYSLASIIFINPISIWWDIIFITAIGAILSKHSLCESMLLFPLRKLEPCADVILSAARRGRWSSLI